MNAGAGLDEAIHTVRAPANLEDHPYLLRRTTGRVIVHCIRRLYGPRRDGSPTMPKPAVERSLAAEFASLAGGPTVLAEPRPRPAG
jgi:hypothetical protein